MVRCLVCKSCMVYRLFESGVYLYCGLCQKHYRRLPGGGLTLVDDEVNRKVSEEYVKLSKSS
jgi:hypothetical protein